MNVILYALLAILLQHGVSYSAYVSGMITKNVTFFYRKLPVAPSVRTTMAFNVSYPTSFIRDKYPLLGIYTASPKMNIDKRCSYIQFGQLRNENLHPHLRLSGYRKTTYEISGTDTVNCRAKFNVQDYIPRNFYLTFGFSCDWPTFYSLNGLEYNISFTR